MIEYRSDTASWLVTCDRCGKLAHVATVKKEAQAKAVVRHWGWQTDTPQGDLCSDCARLVAREQVEPEAETHSLLMPEGELWRKIIMEEQEDLGSSRPRCERCGKLLSLIAVPHPSGEYLCDECAAKLK